VRASRLATARTMIRHRLPIAGPPVDELVETVAARTDISPRALRLQTLLHLPRLAATHGRDVDERLAANETERLAGKIAAEAAAFASLAAAPPTIPASPTELGVAPAEASTARAIEEHFHYIHSFRDDAVAYAAFSDDHPAALATVSPLDLEPLIGTLPFGLAAEEVGIVSRVFAFDWAPRNTITYLLARVARKVFERGATKLLLTYLNPNLGFTGASYRAGNWALYAREHGTRYAYLDGDYITDRKLAERFGASSPKALDVALDGRIEFSHVRLAPLELYALFADSRLRARARLLPSFCSRRPHPTVRSTRSTS
jgi:hypothetical protein